MQCYCSNVICTLQLNKVHNKALFAIWPGGTNGVTETVPWSNPRLSALLMGTMGICSRIPPESAFAQFKPSGYQPRLQNE